MEPANRPLRIGLTGGIGSGKSTAAEFFSTHGLPVIELDRVGHEMLTHIEVVEALRREFPDAAECGGTLSRARLAEAVFGHPERLQTLNRILHPAILQELQHRVDTSTDDVIVIEVPLLFEAGLQNCFDWIVVITAPERVRKQRVTERSGIAETEIAQRMTAQWPEAQKIANADEVIINDGPIESLFQRLESTLKELPTHPRRTVQPFSPRL